MDMNWNDKEHDVILGTKRISTFKGWNPSL